MYIHDLIGYQVNIRLIFEKLNGSIRYKFFKFIF